MPKKIKIAALAIVFSLCLVACLQSNVGSSSFGFSSPTIKLTSVANLSQFLTYDEKRYPLVSAHRGGPTETYPENAIETFANTARQQAVIIECDIRMTRDSVLILMHDERLDRTTDTRGFVNRTSYSELEGVKLKDNNGNVTPYSIPTLDEALKWGAEKVIYTLDVKRGVPYDLVIDAIRRNNAEAYSIVITYSADQAEEVHTLAPDIMISASIRSPGDLLRLNDRNIPDSRLVAFVGTNEVDQSVYDLLHGHGIMCILGTMGNLDKQAEVNGKSVYTKLIENGADILSTDRPNEAGNAIRQYRAQHNISSPFIQ